jgi:hypothetical protein
MHQALDIATAEYPTVDSIDHSLRGRRRITDDRRHTTRGGFRHYESVSLIPMAGKNQASCPGDMPLHLIGRKPACNAGTHRLEVGSAWTIAYEHEGQALDLTRFGSQIDTLLCVKSSDHDHQIVVGNVHGRRARYVDDIG